MLSDKYHITIRTDTAAMLCWQIRTQPANVPSMPACPRSATRPGIFWSCRTRRPNRSCTCCCAQERSQAADSSHARSGGWDRSDTIGRPRGRCRSLGPSVRSSEPPCLRLVELYAKLKNLPVTLREIFRRDFEGSVGWLMLLLDRTNNRKRLPTHRNFLCHTHTLFCYFE